MPPRRSPKLPTLQEAIAQGDVWMIRAVLVTTPSDNEAVVNLVRQAQQMVVSLTGQSMCYNFDTSYVGQPTEAELAGVVWLGSCVRDCGSKDSHWKISFLETITQGTSPGERPGVMLPPRLCGNFRIKNPFPNYLYMCNTCLNKAQCVVCTTRLCSSAVGEPLLEAVMNSSCWTCRLSHPAKFAYSPLDRKASLLMRKQGGYSVLD